MAISICTTSTSRQLSQTVHISFWNDSPWSVQNPLNAVWVACCQVGNCLLRCSLSRCNHRPAAGGMQYVRPFARRRVEHGTMGVDAVLMGFNCAEEMMGPLRPSMWRREQLVQDTEPMQGPVFRYNIREFNSIVRVLGDCWWRPRRRRQLHRASKFKLSSITSKVNMKLVESI